MIPKELPLKTGAIPSEALSHVRERRRLDNFAATYDPEQRYLRLSSNKDKKPEVYEYLFAEHNFTPKIIRRIKNNRITIEEYRSELGREFIYEYILSQNLKGQKTAEVLVSEKRGKDISNIAHIEYDSEENHPRSIGLFLPDGVSITRPNSPKILILPEYDKRFRNILDYEIISGEEGVVAAKTDGAVGEAYVDSKNGQYSIEIGANDEKNVIIINNIFTQQALILNLNSYLNIQTAYEKANIDSYQESSERRLRFQWANIAQKFEIEAAYKKGFLNPRGQDIIISTHLERQVFPVSTDSAFDEIPSVPADTLVSQK